MDSKRLTLRPALETVSTRLRRAWECGAAHRCDRFSTRPCTLQALRRLRPAPLLLVPLLLTGCGILPTTLNRFPEDQIVVANGRGSTLQPTGNAADNRYTSIREMRNRVPRTNEAAYVSNVATSIAQRLKSGHDVVIFIHGGLNTQKDTMVRADELLNLNDAADTPDFVFVNWQSSLLSSYRDRLFAVREGIDYREREWWKRWITRGTSPLYLVSDVAVGIARWPVTLERQIATFLNNFRTAKNSNTQIAANEFLCLMHLTNVTEVAKAGTDWSCAVPSLLTVPFRLVTTPLVDAIGTPAWDVMQRRTTILFTREYPHQKLSDLQCPFDPELDVLGPLYKLGREISRTVVPSELPDDRGELTLICHSMGAIIGSELLRRFPDLPFDNVVFMAAACRVRDVTDAVLPYLARPDHRQTHFYNLVLHPQAETRETHLLGLSPEGSLLVWIDQWFDRPDSLLDRTAGRYVNIGMTSRYLDLKVEHLENASHNVDLGDRIALKVFPYRPGRNANVPMRHGDFGAFKFWEKRFWVEPIDPTTGYERY